MRRCFGSPRRWSISPPFVIAISRACGFSFVLGVGLYGATFLLPVFIGLVRDYDPLQIGKIMMVTGAAQLAVAPIAMLLEAA